MSSFTQPIALKFESHLKPGQSLVIQSWVYYIDFDDATDFVEVPTGMITDGMSWPDWLEIGQLHESQSCHQCDSSAI